MSDVPLRKNRLRLVQSPSSADGLLLEVAKGDRAAFGSFYDLVIDRVYGTARNVVRDTQMAEEIAQEVMVEVWRKAPSFDPTKGSATALVSTIAHRRAVDRVRREQSRRDREARSFEHDATVDAVDEAVIAGEEVDTVSSALAVLTSKQSEAVRLSFYDGRTHNEIAEILDIPLGTAKTRIRDGLIRLRDAVIDDREGTTL